MSERALRLLVVEDSLDDVDLITRALESSGFAPEVVMVSTNPGLERALLDGDFDLVLTDHEVGDFDSRVVLHTVAEHAPGLPCILVSGKVGEETVGAAMRDGAIDYVMKDHLWRLPAAVERALAEGELSRERHTAQHEGERRIVQQQAIADLSNRALVEPDLGLLMEVAVAEVAAALGAQAVSIQELRAAERAFVVRAEVGLNPIRVGHRLPYGHPSTSQERYTISQQGAVLVEDYAQETRFAAAQSLVDRGIRSSLSVAIPGVHHRFGVLSAATTQPRFFRADEENFLIAVAGLIAHALKRSWSEEDMRERALHDPLTGLPNRRLFFDRLTLALARTKRAGTHVAVLFLDIDHFKAHNDTLGHTGGDRLLTQISARIERSMRETDTVARLGGDEFVVLCEDIESEDEAEVLTGRLIAAFEAPLIVDDRPHKLSASIGIAVSNEGNLDGEVLLRDADIAMYRSKERGRSMWTMATKEMRVAVIERFESERSLERAIALDELVLHYQPIVTLGGGGICAVEALVRWEDGERGLISPGEFIPLAEESGLDVPLGEWVLRAACRQAALWREEFGDSAPLPVHVNFSARQVAQFDLPELVGAVLAEEGVPPGDIALEITESALIDNLGGPMAALADLKSMGVTIVLDDFGTGYSSLSYLSRFPIDTLKIDRAFISQLDGPGAPAPIVTAIVGMARALGVGTVAEGIETPEQMAAVTALGCRQAQGFFFLRPAPAEQVTELVRDGTPLRECAERARALAPAAPDRVWATPISRHEGQAVPATVAALRESFLSALLAADGRAAQGVIYSALADQIGPDVVDAQIIATSMVEVGQLWERGDISVGREHVATGIAGRATGVTANADSFLTGRRAAGLPPQTALLASVEADAHTLGLQMAADMLEALGFEVRLLGANVSNEELCDAAAEMQPDLIGLSLTLPRLAPRLEEQAAALRAVCPGACQLFGGQGVPPGLAERSGATFVRDVEKLVEVVSNELPRPMAARS